MLWTVSGLVQQRYDLVQELLAGERPVSDLCAKYGVSRPLAYKWLGRYLAEGEDGLADRSRRPRHSPAATPAATCAKVRMLREQYPRWGSRTASTKARPLKIGSESPNAHLNPTGRRHFSHTGMGPLRPPPGL